MKTALFGVIISCITIAAFSSCEALFSTNLLSGAQRDPSSLSQEQKVTYAQDALASGDEASMKKAYDALSGTSDNSLKPLVAELALGAAGVTSAMTNILDDIVNSADETAIEAAINQLLSEFTAGDVVLIASGSTLISSAESAGVAVSSNQYLIAGVGMLIKAAVDNGNDITSIDTATPGAPGTIAVAYLNSALTLLESGSNAYSILNTFSGYF